MIEFRLEMLDMYLVKLLNDDLVPYSTVQSFVGLVERCKLSEDYAFWRNHCKQMIELSTELHVLMLPGWQNGV